MAEFVVGDCRACTSPLVREINEACHDARSKSAAWTAVQELVKDQPAEIRPGKPTVLEHYVRGHHFAKNDDLPGAIPSDDALAAKARRLLNDKLDNLPAKDLKDIVLQNMKVQEAREKTKQMLAAKRGKSEDDDPNAEAREAAARALGHRKGRLTVVGNDR